MTLTDEAIRTGQPDGLGLGDGAAAGALTAGGPDPGGPGHAWAGAADGPSWAAGRDQGRAAAGRAGTVRAWPLLVLAVPAAVAVWSGWVGIGQMTGFGLVHPLPGIWGSLHLDTAVTLPVGVEAYAAYALRAWLSASSTVSARTRAFARWSAIGSLVLGMAGQVAYHLLAQDKVTHAPWSVTTAVSCLPVLVLVLGMGAALAHLLRSDAHSPEQMRTAVCAACGDARADRSADAVLRDRLAEAESAAQRLIAVGEQVSRRSLRRAGLHGSNADLGVLARIARSRQATSGLAPDLTAPAPRRPHGETATALTTRHAAYARTCMMSVRSSLLLRSAPLHDQ